MKNKFEKIGNIIYGSNRLHSSLESLIEWFEKENASTMNGASVDIKYKSVAINYFEKNNISQELREEFKKIESEINSIECVAKDIAKKGSEELDGYLASVRDLHFSLAQFIEDIGYPGIPSSLLRQRGLSIQ